MDKLGLQLPVQVEIRTSLTAIVYVHRIIFIHKKRINSTPQKWSAMIANSFEHLSIRKTSMPLLVQRRHVCRNQAACTTWVRSTYW